MIERNVTLIPLDELDGERGGIDGWVASSISYRSLHVTAGAGNDNIIGDDHVSTFPGTNYWDVLREVVTEPWGNGMTADLHKLNWQVAWAPYPDAIKTSPDSSDIIHALSGDDSIAFIGGIGNDNEWRLAA